MRPLRYGAFRVAANLGLKTTLLWGLVGCFGMRLSGYYAFFQVLNETVCCVDRAQVLFCYRQGRHGELER